MQLLQRGLLAHSLCFHTFNGRCQGISAISGSRTDVSLAKGTKHVYSALRGIAIRRTIPGPDDGNPTTGICRGIEVEILSVEAPQWHGADQSDFTPHTLTRDEIKKIRKLVAYVPALLAMDLDSQRSSAEILPDVCISVETRRNPAVIDEFFQLAATLFGGPDFYSYPVTDWLAQPDFLERASFPRLRIVLGWMIRGERWCDGFWVSTVRAGKVARLLSKMASLIQD